MKKTIKCLSIILIVSLCLQSAVFAKNDTKEKEKWNKVTTIDNSVYYKNNETGEKILAIYIYNQKGNLIEADIEDYLFNEKLNISTLKQSTSQIDLEIINSTALLSWGWWYWTYNYIESYLTQASGIPIKISPELPGPAEITFGWTSTTYNSFSYGVSLTNEITEAIKIGASCSWNDSATSSKSFGFTLHIPDNERGYVTFAQYYDVSYGTLEKHERYKFVPFIDNIVGSWYGHSMSPKMLPNGTADGAYIIYLL